MSKQVNHLDWQNTFAQSSPFFQTLIPRINSIWLQDKNWPSLKDYREWVARFGVRTCNSYLLTPVSTKENSISYEELIYNSGQLPTRENNWHDFFNLLVWLVFPKIKAHLNQQHCQSLQKRNTPHARTRYEQTLAHFDESGVAVFCQNEKLLGLLRNFQWQDLFWKNRELVTQEMRFIIFGHALYEKLLNPYIGMTGCGLLINEKYNELTAENHILSVLQNKGEELNPQDFHPIPLLGVPNYWPQNNSLIFYQDENYFRKGRKNN